MIPKGTLVFVASPELNVPLAGQVRPELHNSSFIVQAWEEVDTEQARDLFIIDGIVSARSTLIYGEPKAGKSLVTAGVLASLVSGEPFLGRPVERTGKGWRPAVCWTDDGGGSEYKSRMAAVLGDAKPPVRFYGLPSMTPKLWEALYDLVVEQGSNFVVLDVLSQLTMGNLNDSPPVAEILNGVRHFTRQGIPVVMVAHESEKGGQHRSGKPLGHSTISGGFRWRTRIRRSKAGVWTLEADGNRGDSHKITFTGDAIDVPRFEVQKETGGEQLRSSARTRSRDTLNQRTDVARYLAKNGHGRNKKEAADMVKAAFKLPSAPNLSKSEWKNLVDLEGGQWVLKGPLAA
ncbi:AAA family ATPase [Streptosporangium sp. CA-135522]|uniref:AAA family ATPase n=1 Tax=Streptosporangium sp. CA-135522 TaxID=3240072 RepID=UPI003D923255